MTCIWQSTMDTEHFSFEAFGQTEIEANEALGDALSAHAQLLGLDPEWWADYEMSSRVIVMGIGYRDGMAISR